MKYLLDTNVISELRKSDGSVNVKSFIEKIPNSDLFISVITIGEISRGINKMPSGKKKKELAIWLETELQKWFDERIIQISAEIMIEWGKICASSSYTFPIMDSLLAATAVNERLTLVTRNVKDFKNIPNLALLNPWD